jgi:hypothetical protein
MSNPLAGVDTSDEPYVIVSSDTHAGLQVEEYREYSTLASSPSSTSGWWSATTTAASSRR